jgi:protein-L-isoaspartate(D-aspartate) O-methyltransferase
MVDDQLSRRGIKDPAVLAAMGRVPRHEFVRPGDLGRAYGDHPLDIGCDQTISQPYVVASMTEELRLSRDSRVLEVGTGCGYQTAVLAEIAAMVFTIELIPELQRDALARLDKLGCTNVRARTGDGSRGWVEEAPFDAILVAAAASKVPPALLDQLATPGRMVIPVGPQADNQELLLIEKNESGIRQSVLYPVRFVPLLISPDELGATDKEHE